SRPSTIGASRPFSTESKRLCARVTCRRLRTARCRGVWQHRSPWLSASRVRGTAVRNAGEPTGPRLAQGIVPDYPASNKGHFEPVIRETTVGGAKTTLWVLVGAGPWCASIGCGSDGGTVSSVDASALQEASRDSGLTRAWACQETPGLPVSGTFRPMA